MQSVWKLLSWRSISAAKAQKASASSRITYSSGAARSLMPCEAGRHRVGHEPAASVTASQVVVQGDKPRMWQGQVRATGQSCQPLMYLTGGVELGPFRVFTDVACEDRSHRVCRWGAQRRTQRTWQ